MGVWAAATGTTRSDFEPNYAFRGLANDNIVDNFLTRYAQQETGASKVGLVPINNLWGESNPKGEKVVSRVCREAAIASADTR